MSSLRKKKTVEHDESALASSTQVSSHGSSWTKGRDLLTKALSGGIVLCLLAGGAAFVLEMSGRFLGSSEAAIGAVAPEAPAVAHQGAGAYALEFVAAWLHATRDDAGDLPDYLETTPRDLSEAEWAYRDLSVVSIEDATAPFVSVMISANVKETVYDSKGEARATWPRRYFQVAVAAEADAYSVSSLPAPVAAPATSEAVRLGYAEELSSAQEPGGTVMEFLGAYLAGAGDLTRFVSPRADISPIAPAQFVQIEEGTLTADRVLEGSPADGDTIQVLATVRALNVDSRALTVTYALTLTARDERWEVSAIDTAPLQHDAPHTATTAPPSSPPSSVPTPTPSPAESTRSPE